MKQELKFRCWDKRSKTMLGYLPLCRIIANFQGLNNEQWNNLIWMQFIIKEDGNDIYEDDIIQEWKHSILIRTFVAENVRTFTKEYDKSEHDSVWKVIGNIHANPELLTTKL